MTVEPKQPAPLKPPKPRAYLEAGLPLPAAMGAELRGSVEAGVDYLRTGIRDAAHNEFVVMDDDGAPIATVTLASPRRFLTPPRTERMLGDRLDRVGRLENGYLEVGFAGDRRPAIRDERQHVDQSTARAVTVDRSVVEDGMDRAKFGSKDVLFLSAALRLEYAVLFEPASAGGGGSRHYRHWHDSVPLPIDEPVLSILQRIAGLADRRLDRTDVVCAATAILYSVPLYTRTPELYETIKNGLRTIEYGPARNKPVARERDLLERTGSADRPLHAGSPAEVLTKGYHAGRRFDGRYRALLTADEDPTAMAEFVEFVLSDAHKNSDPEWRQGVLNTAIALAPVLARDDTWHHDIMLDLAQLTIRNPYLVDYSLTLQSQSAFIAMQVWGRWPDDVSVEIIDSYANDPTDPYLREWYWMYLLMAGVQNRAIQPELHAIATGASVPSLTRIEELRRSHPA